jgi:hypothetical protein
MMATDADELERLRAELEQVQNELKSVHEGRHLRTRKIASTILAVLAVLATTLSLMSIWTFRTLNNTDLFVDRVGSIIEDPQVAQAIADRAAGQLVQVLDLQDRIKQVLPEQTAVLAGPITNAAQTYLAKATNNVLQSEQFLQAWDTALAASHKLTIDVLSGKGTDAVSTTDGTIVLNLTPVVNELLAQGADFLSALTGREISAPAVTGDDLNQAAAALEKALGVDLPNDFGTITLYQGDNLATAQHWYSTIKTAIWLTPLISLLLIGLALVVSKRPGRTFLGIVTGVALLCVFVKLSLAPLKTALLNNVADQSMRGAVASAFDTVTGSLLSAITVVLVAGVVAAALLYLTSDTKSAQSGREVLGRTPSLAARHGGAFLIGGAVAILVLLAIVPGRSWAQLIWGVLLYAGYGLAVLLAPRVSPVIEPDPGTERADLE